MQIVTFNEIVPGMVLYPVDNVNPDPTEERNFMNYRVVSRTVKAGEDELWSGGRAMYYIEMHDVGMGICASQYRTDDNSLWAVVDDRPTLDRIRAYVKQKINAQRDHLDECERLVDANC